MQPDTSWKNRIKNQSQGVVWLTETEIELFKASYENAEGAVTVKSAEYTIYWRWPFEQGDDELDTRLGNLAEDQTLTYTIIIHTLAVECTSPGGDGDDGSHPSSILAAVQTGDTAHILLWSIVLAAAVAFVIVPVAKNRKKNAGKTGSKENEEP